jgi:hypothetical protein
MTKVHKLWHGMFPVDLEVIGLGQIDNFAPRS